MINIDPGAKRPEKIELSAARVLIEGRVMNIGYRSWLKRKAYEMEIKGWVRNRIRDKAIEAFFVGEEEDVKNIIKLCHIGPSFAFVKRLKVFPQKEIPNLAGGFIQLPSV